MTAKEQDLWVEIVHGCFTDVSDSILRVYLASLSVALRTKLQDD